LVLSESFSIYLHETCVHASKKSCDCFRYYMYVLQLFQIQYFAFFVIANLPEFVLNLQGWSGDNLRFLILRLPILVELALGFSLFFLFIYLFIYIFFIEMTLTNLPITSSDVPPSSSYKTFLHSLSAKFRWYILLESLKLSEISKVTITFTRELIIPTLLANKIYPLQG